MIPSTIKTIFVEGDLDDSSLLLDVQQSYHDKDLLTNHYDDNEDDLHEHVSSARTDTVITQSDVMSKTPRISLIKAKILFSFSFG